ncbi:MAG: dephospho-CoA kinase [Cytophagales bacterium]|nr:MAG: dephospho-CoA kinase [Cytophagales bacterium]
MRKEALKIGITGGIGAGKTTICKVFACLGIPIYEADKEARWLMENDVTLINQIKQLFGTESYQDGKIAREWIAKRVFENRELLQQLNSLVHPAVGKHYLQWHQKQHLTPNRTPLLYTLDEAALMYESGNYQLLDAVILVTAPEQVRIQRVLQRDNHRTEADIKAIMQNQQPEEEKKQKAQFIIENNNQQLVLPQILQVHQQILELYKK